MWVSKPPKKKDNSIMVMDSGLEKTLYKLIKKHTGLKIEINSAFQAKIESDMGILPNVPIFAMCGISDRDIWLIKNDSVLQVPMENLKPTFPRPYTFQGVGGQHSYSIPSEFTFEFLPNSKHISIKPIEATKQIKEFAIWLVMMAQQEKLNWWDL